MKLQQHKTLRSNFGILTNLFTPTRNKTRRGMTMFVSKLDKQTGAATYDSRPLGMTKSGAVTFSRTKVAKVACVKRTKAGYHVIGRTGILPVTFGELKRGLKGLGYTGIRSGAIFSTF